MKFIALAFIATVSAFKLSEAPLNFDSNPLQPNQDNYDKAKVEQANAMHGGTMAEANMREANQIAGVAQSAKDIEAYKAAHR